jgi:hemerythrin
MDSDLTRWRWHEGFALGVEGIDKDHRQFGRLIEELDYALAAGADQRVIRRYMNLIANQALEHFETEELLLTTFDYPWRYDHAKQHQAIRNILEPIRAGEGRRTLSPEKLKTLLVSHLVYEDAAYRDFLKGRTAH